MDTSFSECYCLACASYATFCKISWNQQSKLLKDKKWPARQTTFSPCTMDVSSPAQMHMVLCCCKKVWTSCSKICRKRHGCNIFSYWAFFMLRSAKWLWLGAIIWQWHPLRGHCIAGCKTVFRDSDLQLCQLTHCDTKCSSYELNWNFLDPGKMLWLIWQRWFCSVRHCEQPLQQWRDEFKSSFA